MEMKQAPTTVTCIKRDPQTLPPIGEYLDRLAAGEDVAEAITNIHGIAGIGKTCVLWQLFDTYQHMCDVIWLRFDHDAPQVFEAHSTDDRGVRLEQSNWGAVVALLDTLPALRGRIADQITFDRQLGPPNDQLETVLLASAIDSSRQRPLLVLLDSLDNLEYWKWLQEQIIKPLVKLHRTHIVCASRTPLFWHFWELREGCLPYQLTGFQLDETRQFLSLYHRELLAETVQRLTGGYPLVLQQFVTPVNPKPVEATPADLPDESRAIWRQIGILRRVDVDVILDLLKHTEPQVNWARLPERRRLIAAIADLKRHGYIQSYADPSDRFAVKVDLPIQNYLERCRVIAQIYYTIALRQPKTEAAAVMEWLHFSTEEFVASAQANPSGWQQNLPALLARIEAALAADAPDDNPGWEHKLAKLLKRIENVSDEERRTALHEQVGERPNVDIGAKLIGILYTDDPLLQKLAQLGLLPLIEARLQPLIVGDIPIEPQLRRSCSEILSNMGKPIREIAPSGMRSFEAALRALFPAEGTQRYDQAGLRDQLIELWPSLQYRPARSLTEIINAMHSCGALTYDRKERVYAANSMIDQLFSIEERNRFVLHPQEDKLTVQ
jgi:hypothetical protein